MAGNKTDNVCFPGAFKLITSSRAFTIGKSYDSLHSVNVNQDSEKGPRSHSWSKLGAGRANFRQSDSKVYTQPHHSL